MQSVTEGASSGGLIRKGRWKKTYHLIKNAVKLVKVEDWGTQYFFFLPQASVVVSLSLPQEWVDSRMGLEEPSPLYCKKRSGSRQPEELEHTWVYRTWWNISKSPQGIWWCSYQATLHAIRKCMAVKRTPRWQDKVKHYTHLKKGRKNGTAKAHGGQSGDSQHWGQILLDQSSSFLCLGDSSVDKGMVTDVIYLDPVKPLTQSPTTSFSPNWRDSVDGLLSE